jgi:hypothetical protein
VFGLMQDQPDPGELIDDAAELLVFFREGFRRGGQTEGKAQLRVGGRALLKQLQYLAGGGAEAVGLVGKTVEGDDVIVQTNEVL